ncbi:MAG: hypothetical protein F6K20_34175 [Moorea sp. SIO2C4]|nr:hypothetical protein [Moorena sp. SIO2C4]
MTYFARGSQWMVITLSAISYQLSAFSFQLSAIRYTGCFTSSLFLLT